MMMLKLTMKIIKKTLSRAKSLFMQFFGLLTGLVDSVYAIKRFPSNYALLVGVRCSQL